MFVMRNRRMKHESTGSDEDKPIDLEAETMMRLMGDSVTYH